MKHMKKMLGWILVVLFTSIALSGCFTNENPKKDNVKNNSSISDFDQHKLINRNTNNLTAAQVTKEVYLQNNSVYNLTASIVSFDLNGKKIRAYAYNNMLPGPLIKVKQGTSIYINFTNNLDIDTTVHWHGIRLENQFDGAAGVTQNALKEGENFFYKIDFADPGVYWYHPHVSEEVQQELGLYGLIIVEPSNDSYFNKVDKEETLILDDILINDQTKDVYPFYQNLTNFALMGRYGNKMMINDQTNYTLTVQKGDLIRFYVLNSANVRPFNLSIEKTSLKMIGADNGKYEKEFFSNSVIVSPSERSIFEVFFNESGTFEIRSQNPLASYILGKIIVQDNDTERINSSVLLSKSQSFSNLRSNAEIVSEIDQYRQYFDKATDFEYEFLLKNGMMDGMDNMNRMMEGSSNNSMNMKDMMSSDDGIEWEDEMFALNKKSTNEQFGWILKDANSGKENMNIYSQVKKDQIIKIKISNPSNTIHPMQHPFHIHGAKFLVVKRNGIEQKNLVWKDSVLIPAGENIEIITSFQNIGQWMMHCHIAEHLGTGMMGSIYVT